MLNVKQRKRCFGVTPINKLLKKRINSSIILLIRTLETTLPSSFYQTFPEGTFLSSVLSQLHHVLQVHLRRSPAPKEKVHHVRLLLLLKSLTRMPSYCNILKWGWAR